MLVGYNPSVMRRAALATRIVRGPSLLHPVFSIAVQLGDF